MLRGGDRDKVFVFFDEFLPLVIFRGSLYVFFIIVQQIA